MAFSPGVPASMISAGERLDELLRVARGGDDVEVLDGVRQPAGRAGELDAVDAGDAAQRADDLLGERERAVGRSTRGSGVPSCVLQR